MHSKNTKEMKMLFENWRSHNDIVTEQFGDPVVDDEYLANQPEPERPAGKEAREKDLIMDILGIIRDFSNDIARSTDRTTFILENDNGISDHLFIKTDHSMWRLSPDSDFPEQVDAVDLGPHPKFHVPSEIIKIITGDPDRGVETPGAIGGQMAREIDRARGERGTPVTARADKEIPFQGSPVTVKTLPKLRHVQDIERKFPGTLREGLGDEFSGGGPDWGTSQHPDLVDDLLEHLHVADGIDKKVVNAAEDVAKSIDTIQEAAKFSDQWIQGGELPKKNLRKLLSQFRARYMTFIGLKQQWADAANRYNRTYKAIKTYMSAEAKSGRKIAKALAKSQKILARLSKKLDRKAFRYSTRWNAVLRASEVTKNARGAMRRAVSWGFGPIKLPFNVIFRVIMGTGDEIARLIWHRMAPYSQVPIDPGSRRLGTRTGRGRERAGGVHYDDPRSHQRRTKFHGDDAIRKQSTLFYSEAKHLDELGDATEALLGPTGKVTDPTQRRLLEIKLETQRMSAKIYRKIAHELRDTHKWARRGVRIMDTAKVVKTIMKTIFLTTLWKTPQKGRTMRKPVIMLRILGAIFIGSLTWATYVEYYDRLRVYVGEEFALACVLMIENDPGLQLLWGFSMGDAMLSIFAEINKSAQKKITAAGGDVQAADLDWDELGVWNHVKRNYMPISPSLINTMQKEMGNPPAVDQPPGDWLYENKNPKSLKIVLKQAQQTDPGTVSQPMVSENKILKLKLIL